MGLLVARAALLSWGGGAGLFAWLGLELASITFFVMLLAHGVSWERTGKYLCVRGVGGVIVLWGTIFASPETIIAGAWVKLGIVPFHFWVPPVAKEVENPIIFLFLVTGSKFAPLWVATTAVANLTPRAEFFFVATVGACFSASLGHMVDLWPVQIALSSTGMGAWALAGAAINPRIGILFFYLYSVRIFVFLWPLWGKISKTLTFGGVSYLIFLAAGGLPPGPVFWAKILVLSQAVLKFPCFNEDFLTRDIMRGMGIIGLVAAEFVRWTIYLSVVRRAREGNYP